MKPPTIAFDLDASHSRMQAILDQPAGSFSDSSTIPDPAGLTYTNGYYVNPSAMVVDIRRSSELQHTRPVLAKIYRSYISEVTAVMCSAATCVNISIRGDGVLGVFDTLNKDDVNQLYQKAGLLNSVIIHLNHELSRSGYSTIEIGIGLDDGKALMAKAGFSGSGINDVIWAG